MLRVLAFAFAMSLSGITLREVNGDVVTERPMVSVQIPSPGLVVVVPDRIFRNSF